MRWGLALAACPRLGISLLPIQKLLNLRLKQRRLIPHDEVRAVINAFQLHLRHGRIGRLVDSIDLLRCHKTFRHDIQHRQRGLDPAQLGTQIRHHQLVVGAGRHVRRAGQGILDGGRPLRLRVDHAVQGADGALAARVVLSTVVPAGPTSSPGSGTISPTISLPTVSGWRAATIRPMVPPIEWPITAGLPSLLSATYFATSSATGATTRPSPLPTSPPLPAKPLMATR